MSGTTVLWLRADLRLHEQRALYAACAPGTRHVLPVVCLPDVQACSPWGFTRLGLHRRAWLACTIQNLSKALQDKGQQLLILQQPAVRALPALARAAGARRVVCEAIAAPEEETEVAALRVAGLQVHTIWHSSLLDPHSLPWPVAQLPPVFTAFRQAVERAAVQPPAPLPLPVPGHLPPWPKRVPGQSPCDQAALLADFAGAPVPADARSAFPYADAALHPGAAGEAGALAHLAQYLARGLPHRYQRTRNDLLGLDYSSKWSPWLATGALSPRLALARLRQFEAEHGAHEGSYGLWFELLWRDYFRFLHLRHGGALYRARGLGPARATPHDAAAFAAWCAGRTGQPLVDAAMRELAATGYLSNRLRQVVASYLIHDLRCDWRAGAAWFERQLLDYDVYSNQGNWLYIAGRGTDPRGGRRFDPLRQSALYDPDGTYQRLWGTAPVPVAGQRGAMMLP
ncbi:DASH family cryptochrome [Melaminivora jejuensis]|uniref:DASH family cryptochrome n=1 Tax=Melaminivora jejuensis TaxID=1267217 RepID=UPI001ADF3937|nr:DASH family cryptochrome [Melaminivora jejuensis]UHJ65712.1 DASH family cryptochrome [Melaminivora jejuensis]